jgi:hypothetical protein
MTSYSIEINYPFEGLTQSQIDSISNQVDIEIRKLAKETNGEFTAFDSDIGFGSSGMEVLGVNYNWAFTNPEDLKQIISKLPFGYKILWVFRHHDKDISCVIFSTRRGPETSKFDQIDKEIYRQILNKLKSNTDYNVYK